MANGEQAWGNTGGNANKETERDGFQLQLHQLLLKRILVRQTDIAQCCVGRERHYAEETAGAWETRYNSLGQRKRMC